MTNVPSCLIKTDDSVSRELAPLSNAIAPFSHEAKNIHTRTYFSPRLARFRETFGAYLEKINDAGRLDEGIRISLGHKK